MKIVAAIVDGPLTPTVEAAALVAAGHGANAPGDVGAVGANLRFEGIVRRVENGRDLLALDYETYDPMAQRELEALARSVAGRHGLLSLVVLHSRGRVSVGEISFVLIVTAPHRAETLAAMAEFIDRLKQDVPIWKRPVWVA